MNKQVEKLANIWANRRGVADDLGTVYTFSEQALQVFAEAIVKECAQKLDVCKMMKLDPNFYGGMIRDHFKDKGTNDE